MSKIAVVDFLFNWPPDGGSRVDLKEIFSRISKFHEVKLFVPHFTRYYPRGEILEPIPLNIERIPFNRFNYNFFCVPIRIKKALEKFSPDYVFIADGEHIKPYVVRALKKYNPILRFYSYDSFCIKDYGTFFKDGSVCLHCFLDSPLYCVWCTTKWLLKYRPRTAAHTFIMSLAFLPGFSGIIKEGLRSAGTIIVYNEFLKGIASRYNKNCMVIPSGVDTGLFEPCDNRITSDIPVILMSGRVDDPQKGFDVLLRACKKLHDKGRIFKLLVTTEKKFEEPFIESAGWLTPKELPNLYHKADICIVPSIWQEPFGIVTVEAMACGKPVIASKIGGLLSIVDDGVNGFLFSPGNHDELASKIELLLEKPDLRYRMGVSAREKAEREYNWDRIVEKYYLPIFNITT